MLNGDRLTLAPGHYAAIVEVSSDELRAHAHGTILRRAFRAHPDRAQPKLRRASFSVMSPTNSKIAAGHLALPLGLRRPT